MPAKCQYNNYNSRWCEAVHAGVWASAGLIYAATITYIWYMSIHILHSTAHNPKQQTKNNECSCSHDILCWHTPKIIQSGSYPQDHTPRFIPPGSYPQDHTLTIIPSGSYPHDHTLRIIHTPGCIPSGSYRQVHILRIIPWRSYPQVRTLMIIPSESYTQLIKLC